MKLVRIYGLEHGIENLAIHTGHYTFYNFKFAQLKSAWKMLILTGEKSVHIQIDTFENHTAHPWSLCTKEDFLDRMAKYL